MLRAKRGAIRITMAPLKQNIFKENPMPAKLDRCVKKVQAQGRSKSSSFAICNASIKSGGKKKSTKK